MLSTARNLVKSSSTDRARRADSVLPKPRRRLKAAVLGTGVFVVFSIPTTGVQITPNFDVKVDVRIEVTVAPEADDGM